MSDILDFYDEGEEFEEVLINAETNAKGEREIEFVDSLRDRFEEYGEFMYLSEAQYEWLERIANK